MLSHVRLCDTMDCSPPSSSVHGIFQARMPGQLAISCGCQTLFFPNSQGFVLWVPSTRGVQPSFSLQKPLLTPEQRGKTAHTSHTTHSTIILSTLPAVLSCLSNFSYGSLPCPMSRRQDNLSLFQFKQPFLVTFTSVHNS